MDPQKLEETAISMHEEARRSRLSGDFVTELIQLSEANLMCDMAMSASSVSLPLLECLQKLSIEIQNDVDFAKEALTNQDKEEDCCPFILQKSSEISLPCNFVGHSKIIRRLDVL